MKLNHFFRLTAPLLLVCCFHFSFASFGAGSVMGQVLDPQNKTPIGDATVVFDCQGNQHVFMTNDKGYYYASNIPPGVYTVTVVFMSKTTSVTGLKIGNDETKELNFDLALASNFFNGGGDSAVTIIATRGRKGPLIDPFNDGEHVLDQKDIKEMPVVNLGDILQTEAGIVAINGNFYVHGARSDGLVYYIDQCPVMGNPGIPLTGLDTYKSYTGFIPVKYGDATGGVIVLETRGFFTEGR